MERDCDSSNGLCFFDLPREIRDIVYTNFFDADDDILSTIPNSCSGLEGDCYNESWRSRSHYLRDEILKSHVYVRRSVPMKCASLLRVSRRTNEEVIQHIRQTNERSSGFTARLDMGFLEKTKGLFLEWTSVPVPFHFIKHVRIRAWGWSQWADICQCEQRSIPIHPRHRDVRRLAAFAEAERPWLQYVPMVIAAYIVHGPGFSHQKRYPQRLPAMDTFTIQHVKIDNQELVATSSQQIHGGRPAVVLGTAELNSYLSGRPTYSMPSKATRVFIDACRDMVAIGALIGRVKVLRVLHEDGRMAQEWQTCDMRGMDYMSSGHFRPAARVAVLYRTATDKYAHCCEPQVGEDLNYKLCVPTPSKPLMVANEIAIESAS